MTAVATSEARLVELFAVMARCDGSARLAHRALKQVGDIVSEAELKALREQHSGMYLAVAQEQKVAQEEAIAQEYREIVRLGQRATKTYLEDLNQRLDDDQLTSEDKRQLPQIIQALAKVQQVGTDKLLSITGRPQGGGSADPMEAARELVRLGILVPRERTADADSTAEEA